MDGRVGKPDAAARGLSVDADDVDVVLDKSILPTAMSRLEMRRDVHPAPNRKTALYEARHV
ncbi:MAG: hypothetical protein U0938_08985, partial [Thiobacillus sp.]|nr:hypothetical protein [Thiobacillus sp.]